MHLLISSLSSAVIRVDDTKFIWAKASKISTVLIEKIKPMTSLNLLKLTFFLSFWISSIKQVILMLN